MNDRLQSTLVFLRHNDQILLATKKRGHGADKWNGIGGKVEPGETPEQAAARECKEEIGIVATKLQKLGVLHFHQNPVINKYSNQDSHVYTCNEWLGSPQESDEMAPQWFNADNIPYENMWPGDQYWLPLLIEGRPFEGDLHFDANARLVKQKVTEL